MFGVNQLKERLNVTDETVDCPVRGCFVKVARQRKVFRRQPEYMCPEHRIYISPSTFEYEGELENLLWKDISDIRLLDDIKKVKRESRMVRENSEDALTWNVFRFIEKRNLLSKVIDEIAGIKVKDTELMYWSYSQSQKALWDMLYKARTEFELVPSKGSEPDLIIVTDKALVIIEAKFTAGNETVPGNLKVGNKLMAGGQGWWGQVFESDFTEAAVNKKLYELARFWLLGSWIASEMGLDFCLVSLVLDRKDKNIEERMRPHIIQTNNRKFKRVTWESLFDMIKTGDENEYTDLYEYLMNKTIGYDGDRCLRRAFFV